ncbi:MAG: LuxR C-terminal-related transcriptional regulator [Dehalococcoidia bacterium]
MTHGNGPLSPLTAREFEVLELIALEHLTNREVANRLVVSETTVESHVHHLLLKLHVKSRNEASRIFLKTTKIHGHHGAHQS